MHRDIACRNILVESRRSDYATTWQFFHAKLGDFGLAREYNNTDYSHQPGYEILSTGKLAVRVNRLVFFCVKIAVVYKIIK